MLWLSGLHVPPIHHSDSFRNSVQIYLQGAKKAEGTANIPPAEGVDNQKGTLGHLVSRSKLVNPIQLHRNASENTPVRGAMAL